MDMTRPTFLRRTRSALRLSIPALVLFGGSAAVWGRVTFTGSTSGTTPIRPASVGRRSRSSTGSTSEIPKTTGSTSRCETSFSATSPATGRTRRPSPRSRTPGGRGSSPMFSSSRCVAARCRAQLLGALGVGDRADGGVHDVRVAGGQLVVGRYGQENSGACCPEYVERSALAVREGKLVEVRKPERLAYQVYDSDKGPGPQRVRFLRGSSGATLSGATNAGEAYTIGARAGQAMRLELRTADAKASAFLKGPNGRSVATVHPGEVWEGSLPATGDYAIGITSATGKDSADAYYTLDLEIR